MSLGFENVDKKTLNSYTKKSEKKVEMKKRLTCVGAFWHASLLEQKTHLASIMSLSGNDALKLSGAMMVTF
jgi:hypothetical protein